MVASFSLSSLSLLFITIRLMNSTAKTCFKLSCTVLQIPLSSPRFAFLLLSALIFFKF